MYNIQKRKKKGGRGEYKLPRKKVVGSVYLIYYIEVIDLKKEEKEEREEYKLPRKKVVGGPISSLGISHQRCCGVRTNKKTFCWENTNKDKQENILLGYFRRYYLKEIILKGNT